MSDMKVSIDGLEGAISDILKGYGDDLAQGTKQAAQDVAKECVSKLKSTSPVGSGSRKGHYNAGWKSTVQSESTYAIDIVVHNSKKPGLAHLLENGHTLIYMGKRTGKFVAARPHIVAVEQYAIEEFQKKVEELAQE